MTKGVSTARCPSRHSRAMAGAACLLILATLLGAMVWASTRSFTHDQVSLGPARAGVLAAGRATGLLAGVMLMLQFALSARLKPLDRLVGFDRLLRYHRCVGIIAGVLASLHPVLVYGSGRHVLGALSWQLWPELLGAGALVLLWVVVCTSVWAKFLELSYRRWRGVHQWVFAAAGLVVTHGVAVGSDLQGGKLQALWLGVALGYAALFAWVKFIKPRSLRQHRFRVVSVQAQSANVWTVELAPPAGCRFAYMPGQCAFLTLHGQGLPAEEHPFTISSSSHGGPETVAFTIKASGDFTRRIGEFGSGDWATVDGPYGHFSHLVGAPTGPIVMIAGGIGITPMLSMLRYMAATGDRRAVTLIWANRERGDIVYREELESLAAAWHELAVHHVLSRQPGGEGLSGHIDRRMLEALLPPDRLAGLVFLCGPEAMMDSVHRALRTLGVSRRRIHTERFAL
jgi:predicted ferric reductase